jgi:hypothetical protein
LLARRIKKNSAPKKWSKEEEWRLDRWEETDGRGKRRAYSPLIVFNYVFHHLFGIRPLRGASERQNFDFIIVASFFFALLTEPRPQA